MGKKMQTIYELLKEYTEKEINNALTFLSKEELKLVELRYGKDLNNPVTNINFTKNDRVKFYGTVIPKIKKILARNKITYNKENCTGFKISYSSKLDVDIRLKLLDLIKQDKTNNEICEELNINRDELCRLLTDLKNRGIVLLKKYYSDGTIKYEGAHTKDELLLANSIQNEKTIITTSKENKMRFLVTSDYHYGNSKQRLDLINHTFEYCSKRSIKYILCCGDILDGTFSKIDKVISDVYEQLEFFLKNYPYDKNILTMGVTGDHDYSAFKHNSLNMIEMCNNFRQDIILGSGNLTLNIKNDKILMFHKKNYPIIESVKPPLIFQGHYHNYKTYVDRGILNINVPSLSDLTQSLPTVLEVELQFEKGYIKLLNVRQVLFGKTDYVLNETELDLLSGRNVDNKQLLNIEDYKDETKKLIINK